MDIQVLAHDPEKMDLINVRTFSLAEIARFFGVPPYKVQDMDRATFNNIEQLGMEFVRDALTPWAQRLEQEADFKLFAQKIPWRHTKIDMDWLTHGDAVSRATSYQMYRRMGVFSANDILEKEGRNTIGSEGDLRLVEMNMTTYDGIVAAVDLLEEQANTQIETTKLTSAQADQMEAGTAQIGAQTEATTAQTEQTKIKTEKMQLEPLPSSDPNATPDTADDSTDGDDGGADETEIGGEEGGSDGDQVGDDSAGKAAALKTVPLSPTVKPPDPVRKALRESVLLLATGHLQRYTARLKNRLLDLVRDPKRSALDSQAKLAEERAACRPGLLNSLAQSFAVGSPVQLNALVESDFVQAIEEVDRGALADDVAGRLVQRAFGG